MLQLAPDLLRAIHTHGEQTYPEEGAGFLLGEPGELRRVVSIQPLANAREGADRHTRYLITPEDYLKAEGEADRLKLAILGVFHSHPDHPNLPSDYDREWAQPYFSYLITSVQNGKALASRSWRLLEDRSSFFEEPIQIEPTL
ncbi:MAG: M67 family metallopeptidase [Anaerolineales bacterium]|jgi:proteasome lid subunit RPN8/RPN11